MHIGQKIKELREALGLTQAQLALRAGIGQPYVSKLESQVIKVPSADTVNRLVLALDTDPFDLYADTTYEHEAKKQSRPGIGFCPNLTCPASGNDEPFVTPLQDEDGEPVNFCVHCGSGLIQVCPDCHRRFRQFYKFCPGCGNRLYPPQERASAEAEAEPMDDDDVPF